MKKYRRITLVIIFIVILIAGLNLFWKKNGWDGKNDYKIGIISDGELELVSISFARRIVNVLRINGEVPTWIPQGLGWYRADRVKKILTQESKLVLADKLFFYNFGFLPDKVLFLAKTDDWKKTPFLIKTVGFTNWFKYEVNREDMMLKEDEIKKSLKDDYPLLSETMIRDFADNRILNDELNISIVNATNESGLAAFIGDKLEWAGFSVRSTENSDKKIKNCLIQTGPNPEETFAYKTLVNLWNCERKTEDNLDNSEFEIYFGDEFAQMVKYSSYVGTF